MIKQKAETKKIKEAVYIQRHASLSEKISTSQSPYEDNYNLNKNINSRSQEASTNIPVSQEHTVNELLHALLHVLSKPEKRLKKITTQDNSNNTFQQTNNNIGASIMNNTPHEKNSLYKNLIFANSSSPSSSHYIPKNIATHNSSATFKQSEHVWYIAVAPAHLRGLDAISNIFGKSRGTVRSWYQKGAPIAYDGISYCSEYNTLFSWYLNHHKHYDAKTKL